MIGLPLHEQMHCYHRNRVIGTELIKKMVCKRRIVVTVTHNIKTLIFLLKNKNPTDAPRFIAHSYHHMIISQKASHCHDNGNILS
jgi:hypothetical protein